MAADLVRQGRQRPPLLRLGVPAPGPPRPCAWRTGRPALAHGPPQPQDRRAGLLPLLHAPSYPAGRPGQGRRAALDGGRALPDRQGPLWPGPASGPPLALLVPLGHPGDARPRLPGRGRRDRADPAATTVGADPVDLQRDPAPVRGPGRPPGRRSRPPAALVSMATPTSGPRPDLPLPPASRLATMKITIYGWSTRRRGFWAARSYRTRCSSSHRMDRQSGSRRVGPDSKMVRRY